MLIKSVREKIVPVTLTLGYGIVFLVGFHWNKIEPIARPYRDFRQVGLEFGTDKVTIHGYDRIYEKYLRKYVDTNVSLLEIGLGCGMTYGPGASAHLWRTSLGKAAKIHFIEYDETCARKWQKNHGFKVLLR